MTTLAEVTADLEADGFEVAWVEKRGALVFSSPGLPVRTMDAKKALDIKVPTEVPMTEVVAALATISKQLVVADWNWEEWFRQRADPASAVDGKPRDAEVRRRYFETYIDHSVLARDFRRVVGADRFQQLIALL